jgi:large subunit ribosomal protein L15
VCSRFFLQVLGNGELKVKVTVAATQFSESARKKIEEAGGSIVDVPPKVKWTRAAAKEKKEAKAAA